jgi:hypothetical protein
MLQPGRQTSLQESGAQAPGMLAAVCKVLLPAQLQVHEQLQLAGTHSDS